MSVEIIGKMVPKNGNNFMLMDSKFVEHNGKPLTCSIPIPLTQDQYDAKVAAGEITKDTEQIYLIVRKET
jgi:hypothetical protein